MTILSKIIKLQKNFFYRRILNNLRTSLDIEQTLISYNKIIQFYNINPWLLFYNLHPFKNITQFKKILIIFINYDSPFSINDKIDDFNLCEKLFINKHFPSQSSKDSLAIFNLLKKYKVIFSDETIKTIEYHLSKKTIYQNYYTWNIQEFYKLIYPDKHEEAFYDEFI